MQSLFKTLIVFILFSYNLFASDLEDTLLINGYGNLSTFTTNKNNLPDEKLDLTIGVQTKYNISENLSITAQGAISTNDMFDSINSYDFEKKWLYLDYYLGNDFTIRTGLFQFPIFKTLETGDLGYAKTWTTDPLKVYGVHGYNHFSGAEILKKYFYKEKEFLFQVSYGLANATLGNQGGRPVYEKSKTNNLLGLTFKITDDNYRLSFGYLHANSDIKRVNKTYGTSVDLGDSKLEMFALDYELEIDDFIIKAGIIDGDISRILPDELRYYLSAEYNFEEFTPYIYYSNEKLTNKTVSYVPDGPSNALINEKTKNFSIGLRYELNSNSALKFSYSREYNSKDTKNLITNQYTTLEDNGNIFRLVYNVIF